MRAGLVGYFDLGSSAGLSDAALREDLREPLPDIGMVGLLNPLGQGHGRRPPRVLRMPHCLLRT
jgi:hypothetical protein